MKKLIFSIAALVALSTTSCKKAYECSCTETSSTSYSAVFNDVDYVADAATANQNEQDDESTDPTNTTTYMIDKTTKADVNARCASSEQVTTSTAPGPTGSDYKDYDNDGNTTEAGILRTVTTTTDCSIEKTK